MFADDCTEHILSGKSGLLDLSLEEENHGAQSERKFIWLSPNFAQEELPNDRRENCETDRNSVLVKLLCPASHELYSHSCLKSILKVSFLCLHLVFQPEPTLRALPEHK